MKTSSPPARTGAREHDGRVARARRRPRWLRWGVPLVLVLAVVVGGVLVRALTPAAQPIAATPTPGPRLVVHGTVVPSSQARVGTLSGGVLLEISIGIGTQVEGQRELARVRGPAGGVEVLTAPFAGTVTGLLANTGDTLVPGAGVAMVADLSRLHVETNDVDEFLIGRVQVGQGVVLQVEALDRRELSGRIQTVALQPQATSAGDLHYPVRIDLGGTPPELRPGMSVRVILPE